LFAGVEGVADAADFDFDVLGGGAGFEGVSAGATDFGEVVLGVDFFFHGVLVGFQRQIHLPRDRGAFVPLVSGANWEL
jgi:hypothetical protein